VARNRYRLFGRLDACLVPDAEFQRHMVTGNAPEVPGDVAETLILIAATATMLGRIAP
jgi:hypothetical protein